MSVIESLHEARKQRLQRIAARAVPQRHAPVRRREPDGHPQAPRRAVDRDYERAWAAAIMGLSEQGAPPVRNPRIVEVQRATARHFGVSLKEMLAASRERPLVLPRHVAMYLAKQLTRKSFGEIGRAFGGRDHSSALYALSTIERRLGSDAELAHHVACICHTLEDDIRSRNDEA
jgi:chromosomal replication initiator protein